MIGIDVSTRVGWPMYVGLILLCGWLVWILVFPTRVVVDQGGAEVTVTVYGKCAPWRPESPYGRSPADCATDRAAGTYGGGVVPISLDKPLDGRALIDGSRDAPVTTAG